MARSRPLFQGRVRASCTPWCAFAAAAAPIGAVLTPPISAWRMRWTCPWQERLVDQRVELASAAARCLCNLGEDRREVIGAARRQRETAAQAARLGRLDRRA